MFWNHQPINRKKRMHPKGSIQQQGNINPVSGWSVTTEPPTAARLSAFLDAHYSKSRHEESLMEWALATCLVAVSVYDQEEWVGFAMTFPLERMTQGNQVYDNVFFGNYLCVHTEYRGRRMAPVIIQRCIAESQKRGFECGIMTRVNFLNRNRAWPIAKMPLYVCDTMPSKGDAYPSVRYDATVHADALRQWLFEAPPSKTCCSVPEPRGSTRAPLSCGCAYDNQRPVAHLPSSSRNRATE